MFGIEEKKKIPFKMHSISADATYDCLVNLKFLSEDFKHTRITSQFKHDKLFISG